MGWQERMQEERRLAVLLLLLLLLLWSWGNGDVQQLLVAKSGENACFIHCKVVLLLLQLVHCDHGHWLSGNHSGHLPFPLHRCARDVSDHSF
jgi:hypothetical protein